MMQLYMTPGSCSTGIHILMEELELVFGANILNLPKGEHLSDTYKAINPKSTIPALVLDSGDVLTDFTAIAWWLGSRYPKARLLPQNPVEQAQALELMNYVCSYIHGQGYTRIFTTDKYLMRDEDKEATQAKGRDIVAEGFEIIAERFTGAEGYLFDHFTVADAALFYVEFWADRIDLRMPMACQNHYDIMCRRPVVQRVLAEEGYRLNISQDF
ncbi:MAG: glutathione S-transferase N-terminal domain-containing protein [Methylocystaceae bacterium]|nr:glutathione S-transferase N-terminal domain-containing protein [Methylocystaceae bacterium]